MKKGRHNLTQNLGNMLCSTYDIQQPNSPEQLEMNKTLGISKENLHSPIWSIHCGEKAVFKKPEGLRATLEDTYIGMDDMILCMYRRICAVSEERDW